MKKPVLSVVVFPWRRPGKMVHRYMAFGIVCSGRFSGIVHDYQGGGSYGDVLFLDGKPMKDEERDEDLEKLDSRFPGLMYHIGVERAKIATYSGNDGQWNAKKRFADAFTVLSQGDESFVMQAGPEIPDVPLIGHTYFTKGSKPRRTKKRA